MFFFQGNDVRGFENNKVIVPYPSGSLGAPLEGLYRGEGRLVVDLRQLGVKAGQVRWLSVWCTVVEQSLGHVVF